MYTRASSSYGWGAFVPHGSATWAQADIDIALDGDVWLVGTKTDGRLYVQKRIGFRWSGFALQGQPTWDPTVPPSIAAHSSGVVFTAVKADGRLYTRQQSNGEWLAYVVQGQGSWATANIDMDRHGTIALAAVKDAGTLYTRVFSGSWGLWAPQGHPTWSPLSSPAITIGSGRPELLAVKATGVLYTRRVAG